MKHPKDLAIKDFTYELPEQRIARYPLAERDQSKLLVYKAGLIEESIYAKLDEFIPPETLLVFNNTKVVEARLLFHKPTGGSIELFCLEPHEQYGDITTAMLQKEKVLWKCLVGGAKKWKNEPLVKLINSDGNDYTLNAKRIEKINDYYLIEYSWNNASLSFAEVLHHAGAIPLPPYLNRNVEESDKERYQTIYAKYDGSVAAPTAGLHFTDTLFKKLSDKNIKRDFVTLHVGAGTFKPVKSNTMQEHEMHAEFIDVNKTLIETLVQSLDKDIVAVGTTSMRTIESLYWMGVKIMGGENQNDITLTQWEAYELATANISAKEALLALLSWMDERKLDRLITKTQIIIAPGYTFKIATGLVTNFHQPQSTLLLLVAALVGDDWKKIYEYALTHDFRFLSYGDGCLLWGKERRE
ncbi:S-adenosylmethionine:tRNA ribosyltransferase-isomerase [Foetidibacter luteolus]|uniref:S-adenosylmethionine:tRNA ribosyltransferase-isomerase n=1 Tax=Foetidibacter luteolus TaxID=2608880 RepID=UPI00129A59E1|nr:S-adenosylmethionine:tRNA ribosyltransferase-isomerase [Foetidibacter luteolus]